MSREAPLVVPDDDGDGDDDETMVDSTAAEIVLLAAPPPGTRFAPHRAPSRTRSPVTATAVVTPKVTVVQEEKDNDKEDEENEEEARVEGYLVVDTNFVLDHAQWLRETRHVWWGTGAARRGGGLLALVVPWTVLRELDGLKARRYGAPAQSAPAALGHRAQEALRVLLALVQASPRDVVVQRAGERATGPAGPLAAAGAAPSNDDRILQCAVHFMWFHAGAVRPCTAPRAAPQPAPALLLSGDVNLCVKAHAYDIRTMAWRDIAARSAFPSLLDGGTGGGTVSPEPLLILSATEGSKGGKKGKKGKKDEKKRVKKVVVVLKGTGNVDAPITLDDDDDDDGADAMVDDGGCPRPAKRSRSTSGDDANDAQEEEQKLTDPFGAETFPKDEREHEQETKDDSTKNTRRVVTVRMEPLKRSHDATTETEMNPETKYSLVKWLFGLLETTLGEETQRHLDSTMKDVCYPILKCH